MQSLIKSLEGKISIEDQVDVITTMPNRYNSFSSAAPEKEIINGITINRINLKQKTKGFIGQILIFISFFLKCRKMLKSENYDIVFATSSRLFTAFLGASLKKRLKAKLYLDIRDIFYETYESVFTNRFLKPFLLFFIRRVEKYTFKRADRINIVSPGFKDYFIKNFNYKELSYYTNGIDDLFLKTDFSKKNVDSKKINILYTGNFGGSQAIEKIVPKVAKKMSNKYKFILVGDGNRKAKLMQEIEKLGLSNIEILDPVPRTELIDIIKVADILYLHLDNKPAFKRVIPSKLFEYAATDKPIIAGVSGYVKQFIDDKISQCYVHDPCDEKGLLKILEHLEIKKDNRENFINEFSRNDIMNKFVEEIFSLKKLQE